jgi:hypothetical protein
MTHSDPNQPFKPEDANGVIRISERTLLTRRSWCAAAVGSDDRFPCLNRCAQAHEVSEVTEIQKLKRQPRRLGLVLANDHAATARRMAHLVGHAA